MTSANASANKSKAKKSWTTSSGSGRVTSKGSSRVRSTEAVGAPGKEAGIRKIKRHNSGGHRGCEKDAKRSEKDANRRQKETTMFALSIFRCVSKSRRYSKKDEQTSPNGEK